MNKSCKMELSYPREVERIKREELPVLLPVGTMEYHSTHCPYGCDTLVAQGVCEKVAERVNVDCDTMESYVYCILKSLFDSGFKRNIFIVIAHQTEDYMPMTLACMKAAKKLIMSDLEQTGGYGWWGKNENKDFYQNLAEKDSPWNRIRVVLLPYTKNSKRLADHAGIYECSMLEALYPGSIQLDRLNEANDWFAETAKDMSLEIGNQMVEIAVNDIIEMIKG